LRALWKYVISFDRVRTRKIRMELKLACWNIKKNKQERYVHYRERLKNSQKIANAASGKSKITNSDYLELLLYRLEENDSGYRQVCKEIDGNSKITILEAHHMLLPVAQELESSTEYSQAAVSGSKNSRRDRSKASGNASTNASSGSNRKNGREQPYRKKPGKYYAMGSCRQGSKCTWIHDASTPTTSSTTAKAFTHSSKDKSESKDNKCKKTVCDYCSMSNHTQSNCIRYKRDKQKVAEKVMMVQQGLSPSRDDTQETESSQAIMSEVDDALAQLDTSISQCHAIEEEEVEEWRNPLEVDSYGARVSKVKTPEVEKRKAI
jgi:hypothetical protein